MRAGRVLAGALALGLVSTTLWPGRAAAQKSADTLRIAWRDAVTDPDPYHNQLRTGLVLAQQVWDTLVYADPETLQLRPLLATSWRQVGDTALEFTLRDGVSFHNGDRFTADDVVYTVNSVLSDPDVAVPSNYGFIQGAERIDDTHVRILLRHPFAPAIEYIATLLPILPHQYRERVGEAAFSRQPVGTGPFQVSRIDAGGAALDRNESYFSGGGKQKPSIAHIAIRNVQAGEDVSALLAGDAEWIWQFGPEQFDSIDRSPIAQSLRAPSMRVGYLGLDAAGRSGADNPLTRPGVRQAIAHAVDRAAYALLVAGGAGRVLGAPCYPSQFGCDQAAGIAYAFDAALARTMLAQAGYPDGFDTELFSYALPRQTDAIHDALAAVGIRATVRQLPVSEVVQASAAGRTPLVLGSWGSFSINDAAAILSPFFTGGDQDYARDPRTEQLVAQGDSVSDPDQRRAAYSAASRRITAQVFWLPLSTFAATYGIARTLAFRPTPDELPRFWLAQWR